VARFPWFTLLRAATLTALVGSSALVVDYLSPIPSFCAPGSGCDVVRENPLSHLGGLGVPLPAVGLMAFTAVYTLSLLPGERRRLAAPAAVLGGALGLVLLLVQALGIGVFCSLCTLVDLGAIVAGGAGALFLRAERNGASPADDWLRDRAWMALGVLAVSAPLIWPSVRKDPEVPKECLAMPATEAAVVRSEKILRDAKLLQGLPTTFVGSVMLVGAQEDATLRDAFDRAGKGGMPGVPGAAFLGVLVLAALGIVVLGRVKGEVATASAPAAPGS
jgi:uncharacterized membrane protein